jgi:hypothetical protein
LEQLDGLNDWNSFVGIGCRPDCSVVDSQLIEGRKSDGIDSILGDG